MRNRAFKHPTRALPRGGHRHLVRRRRVLFCLCWLGRREHDDRQLLDRMGQQLPSVKAVNETIVDHLIDFDTFSLHGLQETIRDFSSLTVSGFFPLLPFPPPPLPFLSQTLNRYRDSKQPSQLMLYHNLSQDSLNIQSYDFLSSDYKSAWSLRCTTGREGAGREGKGREVMGWDGKGWDGKGSICRMGRDGMGRDRSVGWEGKGWDGIDL
eukprot:746595-Hanusia_phi.AAC.1